MTTYLDALAPAEWRAEYPIGPAFVDTYQRKSADALRAARNVGSAP